jgi:hypothetical protein
MSIQGSGLRAIRALRVLNPEVRPHRNPEEPEPSYRGRPVTQQGRTTAPPPPPPRRRPVEPEDIDDPLWEQYTQRMKEYKKRVGSAKELENIRMTEDRRGTDYGAEIPEFKKGGLVKKTQVAKVHKGELVIPANRVKAVEKAVKKAGLKPLKK